MYVLKPSLEHMTYVKIVATLFNQDDVKDLLTGFYIPSCTDIKLSWKKIKAIVVKKVSKLPLPQRMKKEVLCLIRPVGFQILKWRHLHYMCYNVRVDLPNEFYWTPEGIVDGKKTAEVLINDESVDIATRYILACIYCLEDDIKELWEKMPEDCRKSFYSQKDPIHVMQHKLVVFWTYHIKGEVGKLNSMIEERMERMCSPYQYAFDVAVNSGNKVATDYFLQKLTPMEREESVVETTIFVPLAHCHTSTEFGKENFSHVLCFLLRELNEEEQIEVFKRRGGSVLISFLDWPLQNFFMETASRMWYYLNENDYCDLLLQIIGKIKSGYKDFDYQKLFGEFWEQSPHDYKEHVFWKGFDHRIVSELCKIGDEDNIKLIFQDATPRDKKYLIYDNNSQTICKKLLNNDQLSLLKYIIKACLPSKDEVIEFKEDLKNGDVWGVTEYQKSYWQQKFFSVLEDVICEFKKRKWEEGDSSEAKRVCDAEFKSVAHIAEK